MSKSPTSLLVGSSKNAAADGLCQSIVRLFSEKQREDKFTIALSGGSLPKMLGSDDSGSSSTSRLAKAFQAAKVDPCWNIWHVILADERCVPDTHSDSNLYALHQYLFSDSTMSIPKDQIYGINQGILLPAFREGNENSSDDPSMKDCAKKIAEDYQEKLQDLFFLKNSSEEFILDIAVLGFGPDGHTCSLFPGHELLSIPDTQMEKKWVASISDSPKPPLHRITLTLPFLNHQSRHVIVCGAGSSKQDIVDKVFDANSIITQEPHGKSSTGDIASYSAQLVQPPPLPCAMVRPLVSLTWILDQEAVPSKFAL